VRREHLGKTFVGQIRTRQRKTTAGLAMPIRPNDPSCQAISIQVSITSANEGSTPPATTGLNADISPLAHMARRSPG